MKPKISIYLDKRKKITGIENRGRYHIKIMFTTYAGKRQRFYFKTNVFATEREYAILVNFAKVPALTDLKDRQTDLWKLKQKADDILKDTPFISPEDFGQKFTGEGSFRDPLGLMTAAAEQLRGR